MQHQCFIQIGRFHHKKNLIRSLMLLFHVAPSESSQSDISTRK